MRISHLFDDHDLRERVNQAELDAIERLARLSPAQRRVLHQMVRGIPNKQIAHELGISPRTAEKHRADIMSKVGCKNMLALARLVIVAAG